VGTSTLSVARQQAIEEPEELWKKSPLKIDDEERGRMKKSG
jgi:hypothetical protein